MKREEIQSLHAFLFDNSNSMDAYTDMKVLCGLTVDVYIANVTAESEMPEKTQKTDRVSLFQIAFVEWNRAMKVKVRLAAYHSVPDENCDFSEQHDAFPPLNCS